MGNMRTRLGLIPAGIILAVALVAAVAAISATTAAASRSCGATHLLQGGGRARVTIIRGSFSCTEARGIVRLYGSSRGTGHYLNHGRALSYASYPGGWVCGALERGYSRCFRGGLGSLSKGLTLTSVRNARDVVKLFLTG